jgi:predicted nicotinamide N-methyase
METHLQDGRTLDRASFIRANTEILSPPLVPEVRLHLAHEALPIWQKTEDELGEIGLPPPFWAFAWAGGQALARHILDHPELVSGKSILDVASGSGLVGIAAMQAGAAKVLCADIDLFAVAATGLNAALNQVEVIVTADDVLERMIQVDVILVGDLFYEKGVASRCYAWLLKKKDHGAQVLIGDPGRTYLPKDKLISVMDYNVPVTRELEDMEIKKTSVWRIAE